MVSSCVDIFLSPFVFTKTKSCNSHFVRQVLAMIGTLQFLTKLRDTEVEVLTAAT